MTQDTHSQLQLISDDCTVHGVLLMDLLRLVHWIDPGAFELQVKRAERELQANLADKGSAPEDPGLHRVLEQRLAFLRAVQIGPTAPG
jgi:hypothetical protein